MGSTSETRLLVYLTALQVILTAVMVLLVI